MGFIKAVQSGNVAALLDFPKIDKTSACKPAIPNMWAA